MRRDSTSNEFPPGGPAATERALAATGAARAVVLVEGISDEIALQTLAAQSGRDLAAERVAIVPVGGAQALSRFLGRFARSGVGLAGLFDAGEEGVVRAALRRAELEPLGFYICKPDLEGELIRALGPGGVEGVLRAHGELAAFRTFQKQPAWRGRPVEAQLWRFLRSAGRRNIRYARFLVEALDPEAAPEPLRLVLAHV